MHIGTAGWAIGREADPVFAGEGHQLQRYAQGLGGVEINSSFYRSHQRATYERWAGLTPPGFRFALKLPRAITHEGRLREAEAPLLRFLDESSGLGKKRAVILVQLPPSLVFEAPVVGDFLAQLRGACDAAVVCEPRHASWFTAAADEALVDARVGRVAADPSPGGQGGPGARPGGWLGPKGDGRGAVLYHRWHGAPRRYYSAYEPDWLQARAEELQRWPAGADCWAIFDNTASGAALPNALEFQRLCGAAGHRKP